MFSLAQVAGTTATDPDGSGVLCVGDVGGQTQYIFHIIALALREVRRRIMHAEYRKGEKGLDNRQAVERVKARQARDGAPGINAVWCTRPSRRKMPYVSTSCSHAQAAILPRSNPCYSMKGDDRNRNTVKLGAAFFRRCLLLCCSRWRFCLVLGGSFRPLEVHAILFYSIHMAIPFYSIHRILRISFSFSADVLRTPIAAGTYLHGMARFVRFFFS